MNEKNFIIIEMKSSHVDEVVATHLAAFPDFFLSFLGRRFIRELYSSFVEHETSVALVAIDSTSGGLVGFAAGSLAPKRFFKSLVARRWWAFGIASLPAVIKRPKATLRIFRALSYRGDSPIDRDRAVLSSIAVTPSQKKSGLGSVLLGEWVNKVRGRGSAGCYLTTDAENNDAVNRFYKKNGWNVESEYITPEGRKMFRYILDWE